MVTSYVDAVAEDEGLPGLAVAVVDSDGDVLLEHTRGVDGAGRRITSNSLFLVGSVAKTMTATLVLQLVRAGQLSLDDRVADHLPEAPGGDATLRDLLTHRGGFTAADGLAVADREDPPDSVQAAVRLLEHNGVTGDHEYSSAGYLVLGAVVERVTGRPFDAVLQERLLTPLDLDRTTADPGDVDLPPGHRTWWGRQVQHVVPPDPSAAPYGGVVTTLADLTTYAAAQLGAGDLIPRDVRERAQQPRVETSSGWYGYGWSVTDLDGKRIVHHTGANPGWFAHLLLSPEDGLATVVLTNSFSEVRAPALAALAPNVHRILTGGSARETGYDPVLRVVAPAVTGVALLGLVALGIAVRRAHRGRRSLLLATVAALVVTVLVLLPRLAGHDRHTLRTWLPDAALAQVTAVVVWALAGVLFLVASLRRRPDGTG